jgi:hypothetical protein
VTSVSRRRDCANEMNALVAIPGTYGSVMGNTIVDQDPGVTQEQGYPSSVLVEALDSETVDFLCDWGVEGDISEDGTEIVLQEQPVVIVRPQLELNACARALTGTTSSPAMQQQHQHFLDDVVFDDDEFDVFDVFRDLGDAEESQAEQPYACPPGSAHCGNPVEYVEFHLDLPPSDSVPHCCARTSSMTTEARAKHEAWSSKKKRRVKHGTSFKYSEKSKVARGKRRQKIGNRNVFAKSKKSN